MIETVSRAHSRNSDAKIEINKELQKLQQSKEDVMTKAEELKKKRFTLQTEIQQRRTKLITEDQIKALIQKVK